jgi:hypothetical protein
VIAERHGERPGPGVGHGTGARDVHQTTQGVAAEQRALRSAHELNLIDVEQLDIRGVLADLRNAVDVVTPDSPGWR